MRDSHIVCTYIHGRSRKMNETLAIRRILGVEQKRRKAISAQLEEEYYEAMVKNNLDKSDFLNISVQRLQNQSGYPLFLVAVGPEGVGIRPLDKSDRINIAVGAMLQEKGYL